jgi:hypothetical protein
MKNIILILFTGVIAYSQSSLSVPLNIQDAYINNTRSYNGSPGVNYWQNKSDYHINASIEPSTRLLSGFESIRYYNNSPDTLMQIVIRLYQNINRLGNIHDFPLNDSERTDGMVISSLQINGENIDVRDEKRVRETQTNLIINKTKVMPHSEISISADWHFVIPKLNTIRMGTIDSTSFFIAYWYPQVAVYDDIDGWDMVEYTGNVEFYNDFNNYDVTLTVPNNMCIWSTGMLANPEQIYSSSLLERYRKAMESDQIINVISKSDYLKNTVFFNNSNLTNSWHITADNISDFTFGMSDHYLWDACSVNAGDKSVLVSAAYKDDTTDFYEVCESAAKTVDYLSKIQPGVPFPFPKMTVFDGEGGMESPMMVNESVDKAHIWQVYVTTHEVAHTYFPFYMGINERKYAWMDEGWAQFLDEPIQWMLDTTIDFRARDVFRYTNLSGQETELPMMAISYIMKGRPYGNASYFRPAASYNTLKELLGDELFKKAFQEYIKRWNGKHPMPYDFFNTFNDVAKEDLSWFWQPWFFDAGYPDLGIDTVIVKDGKIRVDIDCEGKIPVSVMLKFKFTDGTEKSVFRDCSIWKDADDVWIEETAEGKKLKSVELGDKHIPDVINENNVWDMY